MVTTDQKDYNSRKDYSPHKSNSAPYNYITNEMAGSTVYVFVIKFPSEWVWHFPGVASPPSGRPKIVGNNQQITIVYLQVPYLLLYVLYGFLQFI
jgi:hypothetical protein